MRTILCSAGTSIAGRTTFSDEAAYRAAIEARAAAMRAESKGDDGRFLRAVSAETNSLRAMGISAGDQVRLLHSDTLEGKVCAEAVASIVARHVGAEVGVHRIEGLQATDAPSFRSKGVKNLFYTLDRLAATAGGRVELCATGGFKSVVPYMTLFGLLRRRPVAYLFELSDQLFSLPPVPITYDYEQVSQALPALRVLQDKGSVAEEEFWKLLPGVPFAERDRYEGLIEEIGGEVVPSAFAHLMLSAGEESGTVHLSPQARRALDDSSGNVREQFIFLLARLAVPSYRATHVHAFRGATDLNVCKPGNTSQRAAYYLKGRDVYVCALAQHDEYERTFSQLRREQFTGFEVWRAPEAAPPPSSDEAQFAEMSRALDRVTQERADAEAIALQSMKAQGELQEELSRTRGALDARMGELARERAAREDWEHRAGAFERALQSLERSPPLWPALIAASRRAWKAALRLAGVRASGSP